MEPRKNKGGRDRYTAKPRQGTDNRKVQQVNKDKVQS